MKRTIITLLFITFASGALHAQVNKEIEVVKAYVPQVSKATKPMLKAEIVDTAYIKPDVDYNITPLAINTQLQTKAIKPATVTYWEFNKPAKAQLKVGAGYPLNTLLQGYASSHNASVGYIAGSIDHRGNFSDIESTTGDMVNATQMTNNGEVAAGLYLGGRTLGGKISYDNNLYNNYAFKQISSPKVNHQRVGGALSFGDDFVDLSSFNYKVNAAYSHFFDRESRHNNRLNIGAMAGYRIGLGDATLAAGYQSDNGGNYYNTQETYLTATVEHEVNNWQLRAGLSLDNTTSEIASQKESKTYLLPQISLYSQTKKLISPFVEISSEVERNNFEELSQFNPFVKSGTAAINGAIYNLEGGIEGLNNKSTFGYKLYLGHQIGLDSRFWALNIIEDSGLVATDTYASYFDLELANLNTTSFNLMLDYWPISNLALELDAHYYLYSKTKSSNYLNSRPDYSLSAAASYNLRKVAFGVSGSLMGARSYTMNTYSPLSSVSQSDNAVNLPAAFNLKAYLEYNHNERTSFFIEGSNLCNKNLYPLPLYRGYGAQVTLGVKINFR